ncbi:MAG: aspartate kinase [bacterium]|nr:aspartate kinase [bacterium]
MISITQALEGIIKDSVYLEDIIARGLINYSQLARQIKPEVETITKKSVTISAIIMSLNRLSKRLNKDTPTGSIFKSRPNMIIRSNLFEITVENSSNLIKKQRQILDVTSSHKDNFIIITSGVFETTIIANSKLQKDIEIIFNAEQIIAIIPDLASITLMLTDEIVITPGAYATILKTLAWENINIVEIFSTFHELTLIIKNQDTDKAFHALQRMFAPLSN